MKSPLAVAFALAFCLCLPGCEKQDPSPKPSPQAKASPTPKDELDAGTNRLKKKAVIAIAAVESYFVGQGPKMRKETRRSEEKFTRDKAKWREKLLQEQKDLQPQIDRLREQFSKLDTSKNRDQVRNDLARLEDQNKQSKRLLIELEAAGQDVWRTFKAELMTQEIRTATPSPTP